MIFERTPSGDAFDLFKNGASLDDEKRVYEDLFLHSQSNPLVISQ
ncbi:MAG: hypothetical protein WAL52_04355 [Candidatus Sulfotelmatobacter sp.]